MTENILPFRSKSVARFVVLWRKPDCWAIAISPPIDGQAHQRNFRESMEAIKAAVSMALEFDLTIRSEAVDPADWDRVVAEAKKAKNI